MQVEMKKTRMCVHEYIIYIYIYTQVYKNVQKIFKQTNKQKKKKKQIITMHAAARYTYTVAAADW